MIGYLDMAYPQKLQYWKQCAEDTRIQMKIEDCIKKICSQISNYEVDSKKIHLSYEDCYDYILQNGGFFQYTNDSEFTLKLCKNDIMPYHDPKTSTTKYMYVNGDNIDNIIACWSDALSLIESFYCNDALLSYGHDVRVPFNQNDVLFNEIYSELQNIFPSFQYSNKLYDTID